jgi:hypothetical protein
MSVKGPFILVPTKITDATLSSSTIAEPAAGETAWVSAGTYVVGDERIRAGTHRVYTCVLAHNGRTALPEADPMYWLDTRATMRWAMFDSQVSSQTKTVTTMTVVIKPGFTNAIALYNISGTHITITVKDATGGNVIKTLDQDFYAPCPDWYEWLFSPYQNLQKVILRDITPYDTMEYTITMTAGVGNPVGIGMCVIGDMRPLIASLEFGGTQYGTSVQPIDYSYIKTNEYGDTQIVRRRATTDLRAKVILPQGDADYAISLLQDVLATPVSFVSVDAQGYDAANVFGLVSGSLTYQSHAHSEIEINVKGLV